MNHMVFIFRSRSRGPVRTIETLVVVYLPLQVGYTKLQVAIDKTTVLSITTTVLLRTSVYICTTIKAEVTMDYSPGYIIPDISHGLHGSVRDKTSTGKKSVHGKISEHPRWGIKKKSDSALKTAIFGIVQ